jgi:hypothetical protein
MKKWTKNEIEKLQTLHGKILLIDDVVNYFTDKTYTAIVKKARNLKIKWKIKKISKLAWSDEENKILLMNYKNPKIYEMLQRTPSAIQQQLNSLGICLRNKPWTTYEISYLKNHYYTEPIESLTKYLDRTWESIKLKANSLKLTRNNDFSRKSKLSNLLNKSNESFYWLGFLMADGHFNFNDKRIQLTVAIKDLEHIKKYAKFIETVNIQINKKNNYPNVSVSCQNIDIFYDIVNLIGVCYSNKTLIPNNLIDLKLTNEQMLSLIIGFIDGDGNIRKQTNRNDSLLQLHIHKNWLDNLYFIEEFIYEYFNEIKTQTLSKIGNDGYARLMITNNKILKKLKLETTKLGIPYLNRKWDIINENLISKNEQTQKNKNEIIELHNKGLTPVEIINNYSYTKSLVYKTIKELL